MSSCADASPAAAARLFSISEISEILTSFPKSIDSTSIVCAGECLQERKVCLEFAPIIDKIESDQLQSIASRPGEYFPRMEHAMGIEVHSRGISDWKADVESAAGFRYVHDVPEAYHVAVRINGISIPAQAEMFDRMKTRD